MPPPGAGLGRSAPTPIWAGSAPGDGASGCQSGRRMKAAAAARPAMIGQSLGAREGTRSETAANMATNQTITPIVRRDPVPRPGRGSAPSRQPAVPRAGRGAPLPGTAQVPCRRESPAAYLRACTARKIGGRMLASSRIAGNSADHFLQRSARSSSGSRAAGSADQPFRDPLDGLGPAHTRFRAFRARAAPPPAASGPARLRPSASSRRAARAPSAVSR